MPRSTNAPASKARRKKILKQAKGYFGRRKNCIKIAKNAVQKANQYEYIHRKQNKRNFKSLWIQRINAATRQNGISYSTFMCKLRQSPIQLNRKILANLAMHQPQAFQAIISQLA